MDLIDPKNSQVILIGASQFDFGSEKPGSQNLSNVQTNIGDFRKLLIKVVDIDKDNVHLFLDKDNSNDITSEIIDIVPKASNTIIVYYAGHGIVRQKLLYLATKKTKFNKPQYSGAIETNYLVNLVIEETNAKNIIFIIDCCFSARAKEGIISKDKNVFFITASTSTKTAKDESPVDKNYTAFSHELLVILEHGIDGYGEFLTVQDISNRLINQLKEQNLPVPQLSSHGQPDELRICKNNSYPNFTVSPVSEIQSVNQSNQDWGNAPDVPVFFGRTEEL